MFCKIKIEIKLKNSFLKIEKKDVDKIKSYAIINYRKDVKKMKKGLKKSKEELQEYLQFKRRGFYVKSKKGKGSYSRKRKHKKGDAE